MKLAADLDRCVVGDGLPSLLQPPVVREDEAGHDQSLRGGARFHEPALDQRHVQSGLSQYCLPFEDLLACRA